MFVKGSVAERDNCKKGSQAESDVDYLDISCRGGANGCRRFELREHWRAATKCEPLTGEREGKRHRNEA